MLFVMLMTGRDLYLGEKKKKQGMKRKGRRRKSFR